jgi:hypothetical protein
VKKTKKQPPVPPGFEAVRRTLWFHCGWGVALDPAFEHVREAPPNILSLADLEDREVALSAFSVGPTDGRLWKTDEMLANFPPPMLQGLHYEHRTAQVSSRALWMFGDSDNMPPRWLLAALVMSETTLGKAVQCTISSSREADLPWALETWKSILYVPDQEPRAPKPGG